MFSGAEVSTATTWAKGSGSGSRNQNPQSDPVNIPRQHVGVPRRNIPVGCTAGLGDYFRTLATPQCNSDANDDIAADGPMIDIGFGDERPPPSAGPIVKSHTNQSAPAGTSPSPGAACFAGKYGVTSPCRDFLKSILPSTARWLICF